MYTVPKRYATQEEHRETNSTKRGMLRERNEKTVSPILFREGRTHQSDLPQNYQPRDDHQVKNKIPTPTYINKNRL